MTAETRRRQPPFPCLCRRDLKLLNYSPASDGVAYVDGGNWARTRRACNSERGNVEPHIPGCYLRFLPAGKPWRDRNSPKTTPLEGELLSRAWDSQVSTHTHHLHHQVVRLFTAYRPLNYRRSDDIYCFAGSNSLLLGIPNRFSIVGYPPRVTELRIRLNQNTGLRLPKMLQRLVIVSIKYDPPSS